MLNNSISSKHTIDTIDSIVIDTGNLLTFESLKRRASVAPTDEVCCQFYTCLHSKSQ